MTHSILGTRPLTRDDLARQSEGAQQRLVSNLREVHHTLARLFASGLTHNAIAEATGYSLTRLSVLKQSPAFQELIAHYRGIDTEAWARNRDAFYATSVANMKIAEDILHERLSAAALDDDGPKISIRDLVAISADRADRHGYPKHSTNTTAHVNWAEELEKANARVVEHSPEK